MKAFLPLILIWATAVAHGESGRAPAATDAQRDTIAILLHNAETETDAYMKDAARSEQLRVELSSQVQGFPEGSGLPDWLFESLQNWRDTDDKAKGELTELRKSFSAAIRLADTAWAISPRHEGRRIASGIFLNASEAPQWAPKLSLSSRVYLPSSQQENPSYGGPKVAEDVPELELGYTGPDGEVFITGEGFGQIRQLLDRGMDRAAAGLLGFILYHESVHFNRLVTKGQASTKEVEEGAVVLDTWGDVDRFLDPVRDKTVTDWLKTTHWGKLWAAFWPFVTAGMKGIPTTLTGEQEAAEAAGFDRHRDELKEIASEEDDLRGRIAMEKARRAQAGGYGASTSENPHASASVPHAYAFPAQASASAEPAQASASAEPAAPAAYAYPDTVFYLKQASTLACARPPRISQDFLDGIWAHLPQKPYDERLAGNLAGCERVVFLQLLRWNSQGVTRVTVDDVMRSVPVASGPGVSPDDDGRQRNSPSATDDYNHCIDGNGHCWDHAPF